MIHSWPRKRIAWCGWNKGDCVKGTETMTRRIGLLTLAALTLTLSGGCSGAEKRTLLVYCAAGLRVPVEAAAKEYEGSYGVRVELQYGASGPLLNSIKV